MFSLNSGDKPYK